MSSLDFFSYDFVQILKITQLFSKDEKQTFSVSMRGQSVFGSNFTWTWFKVGMSVSARARALMSPNLSGVTEQRPDYTWPVRSLH